MRVLRQGNTGYDVIIVDSSDPVGPAETLFEPTFYQVSDDINVVSRANACDVQNTILNTEC